MFLRQTKQKNGKIQLAIAKSYRDPITKKNVQRVVKGLGFLSDLQNEYADPISHFKKVAEQMTKEEKETSSFDITFMSDETMNVGTDDIKNIGFSVLSKIYHELGIDKFLIHRERGLKAKYPLNNIMKLLVYDRILHPCSKFAAYEHRTRYIENFDFPLESLYRSLKIFAKHKDKLLLELHENIAMNYSRDTSNVFYDVTNYYFHTDEENELIRKGYSKDWKGKPIVQMGLLLDKAGLPITYQLFSGNTTDYNTLLPILSDLKHHYNLKRVVVVADKGLNSGSNKAYNIIKGDGYIFSRSLRGTKATQKEKDYALEEKGYRYIGEDYKIKSRIYPTEITVKDKNDKPVKVTIDEKHILFYSKKYEERARHKREDLINKANQLINSPSKYAKAENYGAMKYIIGMKLDKKTGELTPERKESKPHLDVDLIKEEEKLDGYYSIVTSELDLTEDEVVEKYKGLWKIEDTFKVTKSTLEARPVRVWTKESIEAHFLTCFLGLVILRILEMKTDHKYSPEKLISSLNKANVCLLDMNKYKATYYDEVLEHIDEKLDFNLKRRYLTLSEIKKMVSDTK